MHRNTYILVSILAVVAALVVGVNFGKKISPTAEPTPRPEADQPLAGTPEKTTTLFTSTFCGFSLEFPSTFTLMESASGSAIMNHPSDKNQSIVATCQKDIPGVPLPPDKIESLVVTAPTGASISAKLYHDASPQDGTPIDALIFTHPSGMDVFIAGFGPAFDAAIKSLRIL